MLPTQRFLNTAALACLATCLAGYAMAGIVFGFLPFFVLEGFAELSGIPALFVSLGCAALALVLANAALLMHRYGLSATAEQGRGFRRLCAIAGAVCWAIALLAEFGGPPSVVRPIGLAPRAEWLLAPLPWVWRAFLHLGDDRMLARLLIPAFLAFLLALLLQKKLPLPRVALGLYGLVFSLVAMPFLGNASYSYAAARNLGGLGSPERMAELQQVPGLYNAWTFCAWWAGMTGLFLSAVVIAASFLLPPHAMRAYMEAGQ
ncbi:MAG: hypothetical protein HY854_13575 [Burkholderiales bacterium]|nr:hypothetical protein [Burkholderiales bacterium]